MSNTPNLTPNELAFAGLANEYVRALIGATEELPERAPFVLQMVRLLPRLYISALDLTTAERTDPAFDDDDGYIDDALSEDFYNTVRSALEQLLGEDDTFLEVFEADMQYSDIPLAASISEGLADIFQPLYNFLITVRDATDATRRLAFATIADDFAASWSRPLCNTLRALNSLHFS